MVYSWKLHLTLDFRFLDFYTKNSRRVLTTLFSLDRFLPHPGGHYKTITINRQWKWAHNFKKLSSHLAIWWTFFNIQVKNSINFSLTIQGQPKKVDQLTRWLVICSCLVSHYGVVPLFAERLCWFCLFVFFSSMNARCLLPCGRLCWFCTAFPLFLSFFLFIYFSLLIRAAESFHCHIGSSRWLSGRKTKVAY